MYFLRPLTTKSNQSSNVISASRHLVSLSHIWVILGRSSSILPSSVSLATIHGLKLVACTVVADAVLGMNRKLCPDAPRRIFAVLAAAMLLAVSSVWAQLLVVVFSAIAMQGLDS